MKDVSEIWLNNIQVMKSLELFDIDVNMFRDDKDVKLKFGMAQSFSNQVSNAVSVFIFWPTLSRTSHKCVVLQEYSI